MSRLLPALTAALTVGCSPARGVPLLLWHSVGEGSRNDPVDVPTQEFAEELELLDEYAVKTVTLGQLLDAREGHGALPARAVVLTFDDGRQSLYDHALPLLQQHHMVGELFLVTDYIGADEAHRKRIPSDHGLHPYLIAPEIEAMTRGGTFVVESHSVSHANFEEIDDPAQRRELLDSREWLRARFGGPVDFFAYPYGAYRFANRGLPKEVGYRGALAVTKGLDTLSSLHRISLWTGDAGRLRHVLESAFGTMHAADLR